MDNKDDHIATFLAMTGTDDYGAAFEYLENNDWDASKAADQYLNTHKFKTDETPASSNIPEPPLRRNLNDNHFEYQNMGENNSEGPFPDGGMGIPQMHMPNPAPQPPNQQPTSLLGGAMSAFQNIASGITSSFNSAGAGMFGAGPQNHHNTDSVMDEEDKSSARIFLEKFRDKNGMGIELPNFVDGSFEAISKEAKRLKRPVFIYMHNHKGDSCTIVDQTVIGEEIVRDLLNKFICVGVNIHSQEGQTLV